MDVIEFLKGVFPDAKSIEIEGDKVIVDGKIDNYLSIVSESI